MRGAISYQQSQSLGIPLPWHSTGWGQKAVVLAQEGMATGLLLLLEGKENWKREKQKILEGLMTRMEVKQYLKMDESKFWRRHGPLWWNAAIRVPVGAKLKGRLQHLSADHFSPKLPHLTATASSQSWQQPAIGWWEIAALEQKWIILCWCWCPREQETSSYNQILQTHLTQCHLHGIEDISIHLLSKFLTHPGSRYPIAWVAWGTHSGFIACLMTKTPVQSTALRVTRVHKHGWRRRRKGIMWCIGALHMEQGEPRSAGIHRCFS